MKALLVVDIHSCWGWSTEQIERNRTKKRIAFAIKNRLEEARRDGEIIVFVMSPKICTGQEFQISKNEECIGCDTSDPLPKFLKHRHECEPVFYKSLCDAFNNRALAKYLHSKKVDEIVLLGCDTFACVQSTARGALQNKLDVTLLADCTYPPFYINDGYYNKQRWLEGLQRRTSLTKNNSAQAVRVV